MTLFYYTFIHKIKAAAGPGFVVLLFFFMARLKAFKALGACHPCNYTLDAFRAFLKASSCSYRTISDDSPPGSHKKKNLQHLHRSRAFCAPCTVHHQTRHPGRPSMGLYNIVTYDHMSIFNIDILRRILST